MGDVNKKEKNWGSCDWLEKFERQNRSEKENYVYICAGGGFKAEKGIFILRKE